MSVLIKRIITAYVNKTASLSEEEYVFLNLIGNNPSRQMDEIIGMWRRSTRRNDFDAVINKLKAKKYIIEEEELELFLVSAKGMMELKSR